MDKTAASKSDDMGSLRELFGTGYNPALKAYTQSIQTRPDKVAQLEKGFTQLFDIDGVHFNWYATKEQDDLLERALESQGHLTEFMADSGRDYLVYLSVTNHGPEVTIELGWQDKMVGRVVWDRWTQPFEDPVMAYVSLADFFDLPKYECGQKAAEKTEPPMYRYHPERFKACRTYAEVVGKIYRQKVDPSTGLMTLDQLNEVMGKVAQECNLKLMSYPRRQRLDSPGPSLLIDAEQTLSTAYGRFVQAGRQIMDFPPSLTEMLAKTDIDDIPLNMIRMPYASQYVHFGPQAGMELEPGWLVDGAYVEQRGESGDLRITVTAVPQDHGLSQKWFLFPEPEFSQDFVQEFRSMDLATAIETVLSERLAALDKAKARAGGDITENLQAEMAVKGVSMPPGMSVEDVGPKMAVVRDEITRNRFPIYKAAIQLIVNALCYVAAYPDDIEAVWPEGAPESLVKKVVGGVGKEQARARSKLAALGYVPVHICGKRIAEQREKLGIRVQTNGGVATHWRRGHWRNQVHGPGRSLRKMILVLPVLVGGKEDAEPDLGHLYLVS